MFVVIYFEYCTYFRLPAGRANAPIVLAFCTNELFASHVLRFGRAHVRLRTLYDPLRFDAHQLFGCPAVSCA